MVLLGALLLVAVWAQVGSVPHRPWDAMMLAASPCVAAAALINWDLLPIALTALGVLCLVPPAARWAGVFWGLGMAAKLYPLFLLGPLLLLCLRSGRMRAFGTMLVGVRGQLGAGQPAGADPGAGQLAELLDASTPTGAATSARSGTCCRWPGIRCDGLNLVALGSSGWGASRSRR